MAKKPADPKPALVNVNARVPEAVKRAFDVTCTKLGLKRQDVIAELLAQWTASRSR